MAKNQEKHQNLDPDTPIEIRGYKTDPLRRGYQILWNYENIYWRALVGNDPWSLYEILRSFCHEQNPVCFPSINLLIAILGLNDRRVLTGREKRVNGKVYTYPGLIDTLQDHELVIAEVQGEGPTIRYIFHVNLTPGLLTKEQLVGLPAILRRKHAELLERCEQAKRELESLKRPPKVKKKGDDNFSGGYGKFPEEGMGNSQRGYGKFPPEHYPYNNTQKTTVVVKKIREYGIGTEKARDLATEHAPQYIEEKIEFLNWKLELQESGRQRRGRPITDPAGWLIRAIEKDYKPPAAFFEHKKQEEEIAQAAKEWEEQQQIAEIEELQQAGRLAHLREMYQTSQREVDLWKQALDELALQLPRATFENWLVSTHLLTLDDGGKAVICVSNKFAQEWVEHRLAEKIERTLEGIVEQKDIELEVVVVSQADGSSPGGSEETT